VPICHGPTLPILASTATHLHGLKGWAGPSRGGRGGLVWAVLASDGVRGGGVCVDCTACGFTMCGAVARGDRQGR
jgi:hypothetical protein